MDNERPIEKLLRAYAKKRRADLGAPPELHPATRRMLQGEVSRQMPRQRAAHPSLFARWRPRLIVAAPVLIALGIGAWMLIGPNAKTDKQFDLAKYSPASPALEPEFLKRPEPREKRGLAETPAPAPAEIAPAPETTGIAVGDLALAGKSDAILDKEPSFKPDNHRYGAGTPGIARVDSENKLKQEAAGRWNQPNETETGLRSRAGEATAVKRDEIARLDDGGARDGKTVTLGAGGRESQEAVSGIVAIATLEAVQERDGRRELATVPAQAPKGTARLQATAPQRIPGGSADPPAANRIVQRFVRSDAEMSPAKAGIAPATPLLSSFTVEQAGDRLRVVDYDGSIYNGEAESSPTTLGGKVVAAAEGAAESRPDDKDRGISAARKVMPSSMVEAQRAQTYFFRVSGTNRTRNQPVVFTWNYVQTTNRTTALPRTAPASAAFEERAAIKRQRSPLRFGISGQVRLGDDRDTTVEAVPVTP